MTSRYSQLYENILIEYIYTSKEEPETLAVDETFVELLFNEDKNRTYFFNDPDSFDTTGNTRDYSTIYLKDGLFTLTNRNLPLQYIDFDNTFTNSDELLTTSFDPGYEVKYDTFRIHFATAFNFNKDGYVFEVDVTKRNENKINLLSLAYLRTDDYALINPNPLLIGQKLYNRYIEIKIPALYFLLNEDKEDNTLANKLTKSLGFITTSKINFSLHAIKNSYKNNSYTYFETAFQNTISFNNQDEFELLVAKLKESSSGDYYELYGEYNGIIFEDFVNTLNNQPNSDYVVFHEINIKEQIGEAFIETSNQTNIQLNNYGEPIKFRPVIENSANAVSYSVNYVLRLVNRYDNTQIVKAAQLISYDTKKYGKNLKRLYNRIPPLVNKIYNKVTTTEYNIDLIQNSNTGITGITNTEYINKFRDRLDVVISTANINSQNFDNTDVSIDVKTLGEAIISLTPYDDFILFNFYKKQNDDLIPINLSLYGGIYLNFNDDKEELKIKEYLLFDDLDLNQKLFKISKDDSSRVKAFGTSKFYITAVSKNDNSESDETLVYNGKYNFI